MDEFDYVDVEVDEDCVLFNELDEVVPAFLPRFCSICLNKFSKVWILFPVLFCLMV